jgi:hypothetical protein
MMQSYEAKNVNSNVLRKRFIGTAVADVLRAVDGGAVAGSMTLALCVIDYLAFLRPESEEPN